jgi:MFS family permease
VASAVVTLAATPVFEAMGKDACYQCLYWGMFLFALGNGTCEAVINPLTATLFPQNKTHWLNILHAGWPGGLVLGAVLGIAFETMGQVRWEIQLATFLVPVLAYGLLMLGRPFPKSEAVASGVTTQDMLKELGLLGARVVVALLGLWLSGVLASFGMSPLLGWGVAIAMLIGFGYASEFSLGHWMMAMLLVLHALVGYVELGTDSWIQRITGNILEKPMYGTMLFIWTSALMFGLRFFAGPIVHRISPLGLLFVSAVLGCAGLIFLGNAVGVVACIVAATIYGFGKTFLWPTMLGVVSERFPRGGAVTLGMIGGVGMLSAGLLGGPGIGYKQDFFATQNLQAANPDAYLLFKSGDTNSFLFFPEIAGLDGSKVGLLDNKGKEKLLADIELLRKNGRVVSREQIAATLEAKKKLSGDQILWNLYYWYEDNRSQVALDAKSVKEAELFGGRMALIYTAAVPALMALGYLILILYFRAIGGYKAEVLTGHAAEDEKFTGGVEGPAEL